MKFRKIIFAITVTLTMGYSTKAFADIREDINNPTNEVLAPETPILNERRSKIKEGYYMSNTEGVKQVQYGQSGLGRPLYYYKIGNGNKTLVANFSIHGFEDSWAQDGYELTKIAHYLIDEFSKKNKTTGLEGWSVIIIPSSNPDGVLEGWTNNGPGRAQVSKKIDLNRSFPTYFKPQYSNRYYTGPTPLEAPEAKALADVVTKISRDSRQMVLLDVHGWLDMTIGDSDVGKYFINHLNLDYNKGFHNTGSGYFISYGHAQGAQVSLVELPDTTSASQVHSRSYAKKMYNAMIELMNKGTNFKFLNKVGRIKGTNNLKIKTATTNVGYNLGAYNDKDRIHIVGEVDGCYKIYNPSIGYAFVDSNYVEIIADSEVMPPIVGEIGWDWNGVNWNYYNSSKIMQTGWQKIDSRWYYFDEIGNMQVGWQEINDKWYYFNGSGHMQIGWQEINNKWYYFNGSGHMQVGWQEINNKWYYFNDSGHMQVGWQEINNKWYYFNDSGYMQVGWQEINNKWYYFNDSGHMQIGWQEINNKWYYFNDSGHMQIGWQEINDKWYYFNDSGHMQIGWQEINDKWYYFNESGVMLNNTTIDGWKIDDNGVAIKI